MRRFEFNDEKSSKFWEVTLDGCEVSVRYGKIGTTGQNQVKSHDDASKAVAALDKLVKEKTGKGYVEVQSGAAAVAPQIQAAASVAQSITAKPVAPVVAASPPSPSTGYQGAAETNDLPPVLASPPWLNKTKKVAAVLALEALSLAPCEHVTVEERMEDHAENYPGARDWKGIKCSPGYLAHEMGFKPGEFFDQAAQAIADNDSPALIDTWRDYSKRAYEGASNMWVLAQLPDPMGVDFFNAAVDGESAGINFAVSQFGLRVLPGFARVCMLRPAQELWQADYFGAVELAPPVARALVQVKAARDTARRWLLDNPEYAACGLLPGALGKPGAARDCARAGLRLLVATGHRRLLEDVAARYGQADVVAALEAMLAEDPLDRHPAKITKAPAFWQPQHWTRPVLAASGRPLPDAALDHLGEMLRFPAVDEVYQGVTDVRAACTSQSLAHFAWDLFSAWLNAGAPSKENWALNALGYIGNDDTARKLTPLLRAWPSEGQSQRAAAGLDVLANIGTDTALMLLHGIAQKVNSRALQDRAVEKIDQVAESRGLTIEEMDDRLAPDLGLNEQGTLELDFGPRRFTVSFDEALKPCVYDMDQARLPDLPKPRQSDHEELAEQAVARFKLLKKDTRAIAAQQVRRLESAMCSRRRWTPEVFARFLAGHPLVRHLVHRLVWGVYRLDPAAGSTGRLERAFRVAQDGGYTDAADDPLVLPIEGVCIGLVHALELQDHDADGFGQLFADYEILQPFVQLHRETYAFTTEELASDRLARWDGKVIESGRLMGLASKGWRRGDQDGGLICEFGKRAGERVIELNFEPGIPVEQINGIPHQTLTQLACGTANRWGNLDEMEPLSALHLIEASELIRDMTILAG